MALKCSVEVPKTPQLSLSALHIITEPSKNLIDSTNHSYTRIVGSIRISLCSVRSLESTCAQQKILFRLIINQRSPLETKIQYIQNPHIQHHHGVLGFWGFGVCVKCLKCFLPIYRYICPYTFI